MLRISVPAASVRTCRSASPTTSALVRKFPKVIDDIDRLLTDNRIFKQRTVDIGMVTASEAMDWGFTGPMLRGSGVAWDLRRSQPYDVYDEFDFDIPIGKNGDCYDRYLVRMEEMRQCLQDHAAGLHADAGRAGQVNDRKVAPPHARAR